MRSFSMFLSFLIWPFSALFRAIEYVWPTYQPDARTSLALDRLVDAAIQPVQRSRFAAFLKRALGHDLFTAGHFDPGRSAA